MSLADSLLSAIVRADGDALVMHVGERPYVVVGPNTVNISTQGLNLLAMTQMLAQLLPADSQAQLEEFGAVEHRLPDIANDRFNVVAARGGDDIWIEIRRRRSHAVEAVTKPADAQPQTAAAVAVGVAEPEVPVAAAAYTSAAVADAPASPVASLSVSETIGERREVEAVEPVVPVQPAEPAAESVIEWAAAAESAPAPGGPDADFTPWSLPEEPVALAQGEAALAQGEGALAQGEAALATTSMPEPIAEPITEPIAPAIAEVALPPTEAAAEPEETSVAEPVAEHVAEPVAEHVVEPVAEHVAERVAEHVAVPVTEPVAAPVAEEVAQPPAPVAEPVAAPVAASTAQPLAEPSTPIAEPVAMAEPAAETTAEPAEPAEPVKPVESVPVTRTVRIEVPPRMPAVSHSTDVERLLRVAATRGASALLLQTESRPYLRLEGDVRQLEGEPVLTRSAVELAIAEIAPGTGHDAVGKVDAGEWLKEYADLGRIRCSSFTDHRGPGLMLRLVATRAATAEQLGLSSEVCALATESQGLVIVAGPRASGKTTLLSALVDLVNRQRAEYVITLERQIQLVHDNKAALISQREVRGSEGEALSAAHAALRERPDVLVVDDLISPHMVPLVLTAASEGLLVFVSVAAPATADAVQRFVELASPEMRPAVQNAMAESFRGAVAQTRLKKTGGGLVTAREVLLATAPVSRLVAEGQLSQLPHALDAGRNYGMLTFEETLVEYVRIGLVDVREAFRKAPDRERLLTGLRREGVDTRLVERLV